MRLNGRFIATNSFRDVFIDNDDLNERIKMLTRKSFKTQQILDTFNELNEKDMLCDETSYIIAQKALIDRNCQRKRVRNAENVWNNLLNEKKYYSQITHFDYYHVMRMFSAYKYNQSVFQVFEHYVNANLKENVAIYILAMNAVSKLKCIEKADKIYNILSKRNQNAIDNDRQVQNSLIDMYLKCGNKNNAQKIFNSMKNKKDTVTWGILINGMINDNQPNEAIDWFYEMVKQNIKPNHATYSSITKEINDIKSSEKANEIYEMIQNDPNINLYDYIDLCTALISMLSKCGNNTEKSNAIFDYLLNNKPNELDITIWNVIMDHNFHRGNFQKVLNFYDKLKEFKQIKLQIKTYNICLKACISIELYRERKEVMKLYSKHSGIDQCIKLWRETFDHSSVNSFNLIINVCVELKKYLKAFELFDEMQNVYNIAPDIKTFICILEACDKHEILIKEMHTEFFFFS